MPTIGQSSGSAGKLQRCDLPIPLTNAYRERFAGIPRLIEPRPLPVTRGHQPRAFSLNVVRHALAKAEVGHLFVELVDTEVVGKRVVVGVIRYGNGALHIDTPHAPQRSQLR